MKKLITLIAMYTLTFAMNVGNMKINASDIDTFNNVLTESIILVIDEDR